MDFHLAPSPYFCNFCMSLIMIVCMSRNRLERMIPPPLTAINCPRCFSGEQGLTKSSVMHDGDCPVFSRFIPLFRQWSDPLCVCIWGC